MTDAGGDGGAERFTENLNAAAVEYAEKLQEAALQFVEHQTRMTINNDQGYVSALASLLIDMNNWRPFESAIERAFISVTAAGVRTAMRSTLTADKKTLKRALEDEYGRRTRQRQSDDVRAATGNAPDRTLPFKMAHRTPEQQLTILIPPTPEQISAVVNRIVESSNAAGIQLLTTGVTIMANILSSEEVGVAPRYRLMPCDESRIMIMMLNECLFSRELGENVNAIMPPQSLVTSVHTLLLEQLPRLVANTAIPWLDDSTIVSTPGYNRSKGVWYQPLNGGFTYPATPTEEEMQAAVTTAFDIYCGGFKFASEADKANVLGSAIMNVVQPGIDGRSPLVMITKPETRTGGTYLASTLAMTGLGVVADATEWPEKDVDEQRKTIFAALRTRPSALLLDNVSGLFEGASAALLVSSPRMSGRVLGFHDFEKFPVRCIPFASGNNVEVSRELVERINFVHLEAFVDDDERTRYRAGRPAVIEDWIGPLHRPAVEALLTMVAWWISQGCPQSGTVLPGFNRVCGIVGGILQACGVAGWLGNRTPEFMSRVLDQSEDESLPVLRIIWDLLGTSNFPPGNKFRPGQMILAWPGDQEVPLPFRQDDNPSGRTKNIRFGFWLKSRMGRWWQVATGVRVRLVKLPDDNQGSRWCLEREGEQIRLI